MNIFIKTTKSGKNRLPTYDISPDIAGEIYFQGYDVEISDLSIYVSVAKGLDEDKPRKLAKSVTVV